MSRFQFPAAVLPVHKAFLGKTGSGKTSTAKLLAEQVIREGNARVCVLDTVKSDWWGLISSADGKKPGLPFVILGGPRAHVPLHSSAGAAIGELVGSGRLRHCIVDMADFEAGGIQRFFCDFAPALLRHQKGVLYLFIEEAHEIAPKERAGFDRENVALHYAKKLATAGRSKGIRLNVVTQRTQALHNAVLGSCDMLVAHRTVAPADQEPILKWLRANTVKAQADEVAQGLSSLKTGTGWMVSGEAQLFEQVRFPRINTYDNTATPDDDSHAHEVASASVDHDQLRDLIGEAVKQAEESDPKRLKAEVARLRTELARKPERNMGAVLEDHRKAIEQGRVEGRDAVLAEIAGPISTAAMALSRLKEIVAVPEGLLRAVRAVSIVARPEVKAAQADKNLQSRRTVDALNFPEGELKIMIAIAMYDSMERDELTVLTGYKRSTRNTYVQRLIGKGYVEANGSDRLSATPAGIKALGSNYEPLPTGDDLRAWWMQRLPEGERAVLTTVVKHYPNDVDRGFISSETGYKRSTRNTYLQRLMSRRLVEGAGSDNVRASASLFSA